MRTLLIPACGTSRLEGVPRMLVRHPNKELLMKRCIQGFHNYPFDILSENRMKKNMLLQI